MSRFIDFIERDRATFLIKRWIVYGVSDDIMKQPSIVLAPREGGGVNITVSPADEGPPVFTGELDLAQTRAMRDALTHLLDQHHKQRSGELSAPHGTVDAHGEITTTAPASSSARASAEGRPGDTAAEG